MSEIREIPRKSAYKASEICQYTDTQPYVLRFWESEFPQLHADKSRGPAVYSRDDIELVLRIKELLYEEEISIADARERLAQEGSGGKTVPAPAPAVIADPAPRAERNQDGFEFDSVSRERYEDAVDEIAHLRLQLREAEARFRKAEGAHRKSDEAAGRWRSRSQHAGRSFEQLLDILS